MSHLMFSFISGVVTTKMLCLLYTCIVTISLMPYFEDWVAGLVEKRSCASDARNTYTINACKGI